MSTRLFDARVDALNQAILTIDLNGEPEPLIIIGIPVAPPLRPRLQSELDTLMSASVDERSDRAGELAMLEWLRRTPVDEVEAVLLSDSVQAAGGLAVLPRIDAAGWAAFQQIVFGPTTPVSSVAAVIGTDNLEVLIAFARAKRLDVPVDARPKLWRDVGVMLPVRLETKFIENVPGTWTMQLRIIPDEPSVLRHDPVPTPTEIRLLEAFWQQLFDSLDPSIQGQPPEAWFSHDGYAGAPWETLCKQVDGARAAWLLGHFAPSIDDGTVTVTAPAVEHDPPHNRLGGLPDTIDVWCAFGTDPPIRIATTNPIDESALEFDVLGAAVGDGDKLVEQTDKWWVSFPIACDVGLGVIENLPDGRTPADITALYAVGIGNFSPTTHFAQLVDSGELARVALGSATNTVDGAVTTDLGTDPWGWYDVARRHLVGGYSVADLALPLTGNPDGFGPVPGTSGPPGLDQILVRATWPVLWGHHFRDLWGFGIDSDVLGAWAGENMTPQGSVPPIRIAEQPYGLLPTSSLESWQIGSDEPSGECEPRIRDVLQQLRSRAVTAATLGVAPTAVGADVGRLVELIGQDGVSHGYTYRPFFSVDVWKQWYGAHGYGTGDLDDAVTALFDPAGAVYSQSVASPQLGTLGSNDLTLPLVVPTVWPDWDDLDWQVDEQGRRVLPIPVEEAMSRLLTEMADNHWSEVPFVWRPDDHGLMPDSLLIRLLWQARPLAEANRADGDPSELVYLRLIDGFGELIRAFKTPGIVPDLERALAATLDTATHRIDPWFTAMVNRRLRMLSSEPSTRFRLGVFGWVDGPILDASATPQAGVVHAPSHAQALTAAILRDAAIHAELEDPAQANRWSMQLESARIRLACEVADDIRIGCHPFEAIGRQVERVIAAGDDVETVRTAYPLRLDRPDAARVCHGPLALRGLLYPTDGETPPISMTASRTDGLRAVENALDAYADLLVAEGVHQVVSGRPEAAGAVMDAAAGFTTPPTLDSIRTPMTAESLRTSVLLVIPGSDPATESAGPATIADPSVAAALESRIGPATEWEWVAEDPDTGVATLADLGLSPIDATLLSGDLLRALAARKLGVASVTDDNRSSGIRLHRRARDFLSMLGGPAYFSEITADTSRADARTIASLDASITADLLKRYATLRTAAAGLRDQLTSAISDGNRLALSDALWAALRWGIVPHTDTEITGPVLSAMLGVAPPPGTAAVDHATLVRLAEAAASAVAHRLEAAPSLPTPAADPHQMPHAEESVARAIAELASPDGKLAVLASVTAGDLLTMSELDTDPDQSLDDDWLAMVAAVRPHLARIEASQFEADLSELTRLRTWSNAPDDHWQTRELASFVDRRDHQADPAGTMRRFVATYSTATLSTDGRVAVGLIDSWTESAPRTTQTTTAAFGFDAPAARAPQAVLIAVPPDLTSFGAELDEALLVEIVADTRQSVLARAARIQDMGNYQAAIGTAMFSASGQSGLRLDNDTSYL